MWIKFETNTKQIRDEIEKDIWYNLFVTNLDKLPQIKKKAGKAVLETYGSISLGPYAEMDIGRVTNLTDDKII